MGRWQGGSGGFEEFGGRLWSVMHDGGSCGMVHVNYGWMCWVVVGQAGGGCFLRLLRGVVVV